MTYSPSTATVLDAIGRVCAEAIPDAEHVFAADVSAEQAGAAPEIVPLADDFTEVGLPAVLVALGQWESAFRTSLERLTLIAECSVWRERFPLGENAALLYQDRDALAEAFIEHAKLYFADPAIQSAVLMGGSRLVTRAIPRGTGDQQTGPRLFLTLPFRIKVVCERVKPAQPA